MIIRHVTCLDTPRRVHIEQVQVGDTAWASLEIATLGVEYTMDELVYGHAARFPHRREVVAKLRVRVLHPEPRFNRVLFCRSDEYLQIDWETAVRFHPQDFVEANEEPEQVSQVDVDEAIRAADRVLAKPI